MRGFLNDFFDGKLRLWKAYLFCISGSYSTFLICSFLLSFFDHGSIYFKLIIALNFIGWLYFFIGAWRCSFNTDYLFCAYITRFILFASAVKTVQNIEIIINKEYQALVATILISFLCFLIYKRRRQKNNQYYNPFIVTITSAINDFLTKRKVK